ncbi:roadblock/LC7 domain-containing protein [Candidatus Obscuribacterales bacterium]|nr:roadblock/LC7 domain-containing protein [Candidatus Obscuribacterales bacterium]MBX3149612.1 roadblock/LC7 domain-containing protein [Candidatus Obscuribacterales bacterium]
MSCSDYQTIIRQWFEDVMDSHISKCDSCAEFFRGLNQMTLHYLEQRRIQLMAATPSPFDQAPPYLEPLHSDLEEQLTQLQHNPATSSALAPGQHMASGLQSQQPTYGAPPNPSQPNIQPIPPKAVGATGRLNPNPEIDPNTPGLICNIGRFILDDRELEMLRGMTAAAPSELGLRILTIKALEDLRGILNEITRHEEVVGWAIIGSDGLMVAGSLPDELNSENLAVRALSIYMGTEAMLEGIGNERLQQIILYTEMGAVFVANFGEGIFITISNATQPDKIIRTLKKIRDVS